QCSVFTNVAASRTLQVVFNGITNPSQGSYQLKVSTSADTAVVSSSNYTVAAPNPVSTPAVVIDTPSNGAGARTQYTITFNTSSTGGLSQAGNSTVSITFPSGTAFTAWNGGNVYDGGTRIGSCAIPSGQAPLTSVCGIFGAI